MNISKTINFNEKNKQNNHFVHLSTCKDVLNGIHCDCRTVDTLISCFKWMIKLKIEFLIEIIKRWVHALTFGFGLHNVNNNNNSSSTSSSRASAILHWKSNLNFKSTQKTYYKRYDTMRDNTLRDISAILALSHERRRRRWRRRVKDTKSKTLL